MSEKFDADVGVVVDESRGNYIYTYSGRRFFIDDPRPEDIHIDDIAHALAFQCRFNGHCPEYYSVAQHSVLVSRMVPPQDALWGLLHDASETYLPDVPRPFKAAMTNFKELEERIMRVVAEWAGLDWPSPESVHHVDRHIVGAEAQGLWPVPPEWSYQFKPLPYMETITSWDPGFAEFMFLNAYNELKRN